MPIYIRKPLLALTILISIVVFIGNAYAPVLLKLKVHVSVSCDDETTKNMIVSNINRELRTLGDVELVKLEDAERILFLIAIQHTYKQSGNKTGQISLTVMRLHKYPAGASMLMAINEYRNTFEKGLTYDVINSRFTKTMEIIDKRTLLSTFYLPDLSLIVSIDNNDLPNTCKEIVATFDVKDLEPARKRLRELKKTIDSINQK